MSPDLRAQVNANFLIRYRFKGQKKWYLIGAGKLHTHVGKERAEKYGKKAMNSDKQNIKFSYRNTVEYLFISR